MVADGSNQPEGSYYLLAGHEIICFCFIDVLDLYTKARLLWGIPSEKLFVLQDTFSPHCHEKRLYIYI